MSLHADRSEAASRSGSTTELPDALDADLAPPDLPEPSSSAGVSAPRGQHGSVKAKQAFDNAVAAARQGNEKDSVNAFLEAAANAESAHEWYLVAVSCQRVGDFLLDEKPPTDLERALRMYRRSAAAYERCGLYKEARDLSYAIMKVRLSRARELGISRLQQVESVFYWLTAGFGFRPGRVFATAAIVIVVYGMLYWLIGGAVETGSREIAGFWDSLYFSGITFATVGYGDLIPAHHARLLALTEGFFGAFLMGVFVVTLTYRLARP